ncbi:MAG: RNA polymerase sigma factor [Phycisphaerales bacterium]
MSTSARQLLLDTHRGDHAAAEALWDLFAPRLRLCAMTILRNGADADDAVQHAMCGILALPSARVTEIRDVAPFLVRVVRRTALNMLRSARRERRRASATARHDDAPHRDLHAIDPDLALAIDALPRRLAEVIILKHIVGMTFDELAAALDQNRRTVAACHRAAIERLRIIVSARRDAPANSRHISPAVCET